MSSRASTNGAGAFGEAGIPARVVVVGGGIAGLEALLALRHLAGERTRLTLVSAEPEFVYRPMLVDEPFSGTPAARHDLAGVVAELGARFVHDAVTGIDPEERTIELAGGEPLAYDAAIVTVGARPRMTLPAASLVGPGARPINELLGRAAEHPSSRIAFIVTPGVSWPLPLYELALMAARRARELGHELEPVIVTPEAGPLIMFGPIPSRRVHELLRVRGIAFLPATYARSDADDGIVLSPGDNRLEAGVAVALPVLDGAAIDGIPVDRDGFIPIDDHARVPGFDGLYAAGDGTTFPIKQGGIASQQADAAAEHIAAELGVISEPRPFHPILRGQLIVGDESINLRADVAGGGGEGMVSDDYLWWPPRKLAARFLGPWLEGEARDGDLEPPRHPVDVEVALPREWHREPMALDPYASLSRG